MQTDIAFLNCARLAKEMGLADVVKDRRLEEVVSTLAKTDNGAKWLKELSRVVREYGLRHAGGCLNIAQVSWLRGSYLSHIFYSGFDGKNGKGRNPCSQGGA